MKTCLFHLSYTVPYHNPINQGSRAVSFMSLDLVNVAWDHMERVEINESRVVYMDI